MSQKKQIELRTDLMYDPVESLWVHVQDGVARIGLSPLVQESTGSFVAVRFGEVGSSLDKGESFVSLEAEKHVGHLKSPFSGIIVRVNEEVVEHPRLINTDPYGRGWLMEIRLSRPEELQGCIQGEEAVRAWFEAELQKYNDKGWLAQA